MNRRVVRQYSLSGLGAPAAVTALAALTMLMGAACKPTPAPVDVTTVAPCEHEYGPATRASDPCVWDGGPDVNGSARWVFYADSCPVRTVQLVVLVDCIARDTWGE